MGIEILTPSGEVYFQDHRGAAELLDQYTGISLSKRFNDKNKYKESGEAGLVIVSSNQRRKGTARCGFLGSWTRICFIAGFGYELDRRF